MKIIHILFLFLSGITAIAQQQCCEYAVKAAVGARWNEGKSQSGNGLLYKLGLQCSFGTRERIRLNAGFVYGDFSSLKSTKQKIG